MFSKIINRINLLKMVKPLCDYPKTIGGIICGGLFNLNVLLLKNKNLDKDLFETVLLIA